MAIHIGYKIPKNWKVIIWARYFHTNPESFEDPTQTDGMSVSNCKLREKAEYYAWLIITTIFLHRNRQGQEHIRFLVMDLESVQETCLLAYNWHFFYIICL